MLFQNCVTRVIVISKNLADGQNKCRSEWHHDNPWWPDDNFHSHRLSKLCISRNVSLIIYKTESESLLWISFLAFATFRERVFPLFIARYVTCYVYLDRGPDRERRESDSNLRAFCADTTKGKVSHLYSRRSNLSFDYLLLLEKRRTLSFLRRAAFVRQQHQYPCLRALFVWPWWNDYSRRSDWEWMIQSQDPCDHSYAILRVNHMCIRAASHTQQGLRRFEYHPCVTCLQVWYDNCHHALLFR
jgi:hypothetical protein